MIHVKELVWDDWNVAHIARHDVTPAQVEEVCQAFALVLQGSKGRLVFIAPTVAGRLLAVILDPEPDVEEGVYYPVTARPAARKERRLYQQHIQGGQP